MTEKSKSIKCGIGKIEVTDDILTSRAGLALVAQYLHKIKIADIIATMFARLRRSKKGVALSTIIYQILCFFKNGSHWALSYFDRLQQDRGYATTIGIDPSEMVSSHTVKRFLRSFSILRAMQLRRILQRLFIWRLKLEQPERIILGLDTMVMDNDDALKREGVEPTYKSVKGFQPLHLYWGRYLIDTILREGKAHSNHGNHARLLVNSAVGLIRKQYSDTVPIILRADSGFMDHKLFEVCESLSIGFIIGARCMPI